MAQRRVKLSWLEALGPEPPPSSQGKKPSPKPKSRAKKSDAKRKKRHPNDVMAKQDMDAIASFDDSSRVTDSSDDNDDDEPPVMPLADSEAAKAVV
ncbi:hypothetical protein PF005_g5144 [Phytophthora fragariae]|nr:hypothetical protein PF003_g9701 [Phytophthora fragariae]KAE9022821.1 hypothetical protein PF011_g4271 [Phytophthora fragariae]KAE9128214.1 hypothetical protein PF007_g5332 [Phytophthora fragariae]KAE9128437.1 hypothetical protein PF010_g4501 [Phytophthora fragariae]KAE9151403.1 hypothetical protein PF006_g4286 [Phytophthora fragariae]